MIKKIAALGITAALAFAPVARFRRGRRPRPPSPMATPMKPMPRSTKHEDTTSRCRSSTKKMRRSRWPRRRRPTPRRAEFGTSTAISRSANRWHTERGPLPASVRAALFFFAREEAPRCPGCCVLVRVRLDLFLSRRYARRRAGRASAASSSNGGRSCSGRCSSRRAGAIRRSTSIPSRAATCGATSSASARRSACRSPRPEPFPQNSLLAARVAILLEGEARAEFSRRVYLAEFGEGRPISDPDTLAALIAEARPRRRGDVRRRPARRQQGQAEGRLRRSQDARPARRALPGHRGRRSVLGQRPARTGARLGDRQSAEPAAADRNPLARIGRPCSAPSKPSSIPCVRTTNRRRRRRCARFYLALLPAGLAAARRADGDRLRRSRASKPMSSASSARSST